MQPRIKCKNLTCLQIQLQRFSTEGDLAVPGGDVWKCLGMLVVITTGGRERGTWWAEPGALLYYTSCSAHDSPTAKSTEAEKRSLWDPLPTHLSKRISRCSLNSSKIHHTGSLWVPVPLKACSHLRAFVLIIPAPWNASPDILCPVDFSFSFSLLNHLEPPSLKPYLATYCHIN